MGQSVGRALGVATVMIPPMDEVTAVAAAPAGDRPYSWCMASIFRRVILPLLALRRLGLGAGDCLCRIHILPAYWAL